MWQASRMGSANSRQYQVKEPCEVASANERFVAGIGNVWMAETLWAARLSPWLRLGDVPEEEQVRVLETAASLMRAAVEGGREPARQVYGKSGRPCPHCRTAIRAWGQGDANRTAYWCPACQPGPAPRAWR